MSGGPFDFDYGDAARGLSNGGGQPNPSYPPARPANPLPPVNGGPPQGAPGPGRAGPGGLAQPGPFGPGPAHPGSGVPSSAGDAATPQIGHCPWWLLAACTGASVIAAVVALLAGASIGPVFIAWALAGPVAFSLLALYVSKDTRERARGLYTAPTWAPAGYWVAVIVALVAVIVTAWRIAQWAGRL